MTISNFCSVVGTISNYVNLYQNHYFHPEGREEFLGRSLLGGARVIQDRVIIRIIKNSKIPRPSLIAPIYLSDFFQTRNSDYSFSFPSWQLHVQS